MPPDEGVPPAEASNTEPAAEPQNTDNGQAPRPSSGGRQEYVSMGINIERERIMKRFGVENYDELEERLTAPPAQEGQQTANGQEVDVTGHPKFEEMTRTLGTFERKMAELERDKQVLSAQADEARLEKLRSAALARGVGPGQQLEAFTRLYGDRVRFGADRELEVLGKLQDGTLAPMGESLDDFIAGALDESKFLVAPENRSGVGSRQQPTQDTSRAQKDDLYAWGLDNGPQSSKVDRFFSRRPQSETKK